MFVARMAHLGRSCRGGIPLHHGDRHSRKPLEPLTIGERDGNMPQDRLTPPVEGRQPPRLATEANKFPIRGGYRSYGAFGSFKIGAAPAVYHPVGLAPGLSSLSSLSSHISAGAAGSEGALGSLFDDCFRPLLGLTPPFPASLHPGWPGPREVHQRQQTSQEIRGGDPSLVRGRDS
jgi:hypothetical protein